MSRCPECGEKYIEKIRGKKATIPEEIEYCFHKVWLADGNSIGKWYIHEEY